MPVTSYPKAHWRSVLEHSLGCAISQHVDAKQLSSPTKQSQAMTNHK